MFSQTDFSHMDRALTLAARGMFTTTPNPRVGCVLVKNGDVIGEGFTQPAGQDHAEIRALKDARSRGHDPRGATAYVTLEPCSHFGRTPPCVHALIDARLDNQRHELYETRTGGESWEMRQSSADAIRFPHTFAPAAGERITI